MSDNLFKNHSVQDIEAAIADALTKLLGPDLETTVQIGELKFGNPLWNCVSINLEARCGPKDKGDLPF